MRLFGVCVLVAVGFGLSVVGAARAVEAWALYDAFNENTIDAARWIGDEYKAHGGDANRILLSGTLRMRYAGYGETTSNTSGVLSSLLLSFIDPAPITAVKATINAFNYGLQGCSGNPSYATDIRSEVMGLFFSAGTPTPGSSTDNVYAYSRLRRLHTDAVDTFRVQVGVYRCLDTTCSTSTGFFYQMGTISRGTPATVSVVWDKPNKKFIFQWGSTSIEYSYPWSDSSPPPWKGST